jgi:hypothetical protein
MRARNSYPTAKQEGEFLWDLVDSTRKLKRKQDFLRAMMAAAVEAVAFVQEAVRSYSTLRRTFCGLCYSYSIMCCITRTLCWRAVAAVYTWY